jgi:hypothetical protein
MIEGSGSTNYLAKWSSNTSLSVSRIYDNGSSISIGTSSTLPNVFCLIKDDASYGPTILGIQANKFNSLTSIIQFYDSSATPTSHIYYSSNKYFHSLNLGVGPVSQSNTSQIYIRYNSITHSVKTILEKVSSGESNAVLVLCGNGEVQKREIDPRAWLGHFPSGGLGG